ncbi:hypothetical protein BH24ACT26_BH24ACT26_19550 [soil metagenome]
MTPPGQGAEAPAGPPGPLSFTEMIREAWRLYRMRPLVVIPIFAALYLCVALLAVSVAGQDRLAGSGRIVVGIAFQFGVPLAGTILTALAVVVMHDESVGNSSSLGSAWSGLAALWKELLAAALLAAIVSLVLYVPPLSIIAVYIGSSGLSAVLFGPPLVIHAMVLERRSLAQSWVRTRALMQGNWARVLLYWLTIALTVTVVGGLLTVPAQSVGTTTLLLVNGLILGVLVPYVAAFVLASYLDVRAQHDRDAGEAPA